MPHIAAYVPDEQLAGREEQLISSLTDAVAEVYGDWARELVTVVLVAVPGRGWGKGGSIDHAPAPVVHFGIRAAAFARPDADRLAGDLVRALTAAVGGVVGERSSAATYVELIATAPGRSAVGGVLVD